MWGMCATTFVSMARLKTSLGLVWLALVSTISALKNPIIPG